MTSLASDRRRQLVLLAAIMGSFVAGLDATAVNVALPAIRADLGGGLAGQQWVSNAYLLALSSLILVGGTLGDVFGERRVFSIGVAGFGVVSLLCSIAPSIEALVVLRALQGAFGALLTPSALAVIIAAFPRNERGAAIGSWTAWAGIATVIGPLAGGYLVDSLKSPPQPEMTKPAPTINRKTEPTLMKPAERFFVGGSCIGGATGGFEAGICCLRAKMMVSNWQ